MNLPPLADQSDLEAALQRAVDPVQAQTALRRASARVRQYCRQQFTITTDDTITLPGNCRVLTLPQRPLIVDADHPLTVTELIGISQTEYPCLEHRDYTRLGSQLTRGDQIWAPTRLMGWPHMRPYGAWAENVRVTCSHGYATVPDDVLDVVLDLAAMGMTNPQGLRSESIDDYSRTFASETIGAGSLTADHKASLRPYRGGAFNVTPSR